MQAEYNISELEELLKSRLGSGLEDVIEAKLKKFNYLISREIAIEILAREHNLLPSRKEKFLSIAEVKKLLHEGAKHFNVSIKATISTFLPTRVIMKNGNVYRMRELILEEESERCRLSFWDESIDLLNNFSIGDTILFKNLYLSSGYLTYSKYSSYEICEKILPFDPSEQKKQDNKKILVQGSVIEIEPPYHYLKNGREAIMKSFRIAIGNATYRVVVWDNPERVDKLTEGDMVRIEGVTLRNNEFHANWNSRIIKLRLLGKDIVLGKVEALVHDNDIILYILSKKYILPRNLLMKIFGRNINQDITSETLLEISKNKLLGKKVAIKPITNDSQETSNDCLVAKDIYLIS